jgi:hypothetical protein
VFKNIARAAILVICFAAVGFRAYGYENGDFQIWNTDAEEIRIGKDTKFVMEQEFRYGENAGELFYQHYDWGFAWAFDKRLEISTGYRLVFERYKKKWRESDEPFLNITPKIDLWGFKLDDRNRIEYRHFRFADDQIRYRNRFTVKYPIAFHSIKIAPYISNEIFVSSNGTGYNQNRFQSGLEFELTKYVKADLSYMMQQVRIKNDKWKEANVLWAKLKIAF